MWNGKIGYARCSTADQNPVSCFSESSTSGCRKLIYNHRIFLFVQIIYVCFRFNLEIFGSNWKMSTNIYRILMFPNICGDFYFSYFNLLTFFPVLIILFLIAITSVLYVTIESFFRNPYFLHKFNIAFSCFSINTFCVSFFSFYTFLFALP